MGILCKWRSSNIEVLMDEVALCILEPNGTFYVKGKSPSSSDASTQNLQDAVERLTAEVKAMRALLTEQTPPAA